MPANKNAMTRYKLLDDLLSNRYHDYSIADMTEYVNERLAEYGDGYSVSRRAIEKDIKYLEEGPFGADIERYTVDAVSRDGRTTVKKRCLRYSEEGFSIFKQEMSADEKLILRDTLRVIGQFDGLPNFDKLEGLRRRLNATGDDREIVSFTRNPLDASNILGVLFTAISQQVVVEFKHYQFDHPDDKRTFRVNPILLKEYNCRWFLVGSIVDKGNLYTFALDRILDLKMLPEAQYQPYDGDLSERFDDIIGMTDYKRNPVLDIVFWANNIATEYIRSKPMHISQKMLCGERDAELRRRYPALAGGRFFSIKCKKNYELIRELMSFKYDLIVLSPKEIQDEIIQTLDKMVARYKDL